jgi:hypothetical protein
VKRRREEESPLISIISIYWLMQEEGFGFETNDRPYIFTGRLE